MTKNLFKDYALNEKHPDFQKATARIEQKAAASSDRGLQEYP